MMIELYLLKQAVMDSRDGITISDASVDDNPLIFVNPAFERLTGYRYEDIINRNCRFLQKDDRDQPALPVIRSALAQGEPCLVTLRNYRKDGSMFWNELSISPIYNKNGDVTNFIGIQKDVTNRVLLEQQLRKINHSLEATKTELEQLATLDGLTGIYNRRFFDNQFEIQWNIAKRNSVSLALFFVDIDHFKKYNDTYGHQAGDDAIRRVAERLNRAFRRSSDFIARYGGEEFVILSTGMTEKNATEYAESLCEGVRTLNIPHAASDTGYLTISIGFAVRTPKADDKWGELLQSADMSLYQAKHQGRNRTVGRLN